MSKKRYRKPKLDKGEIKVQMGRIDGDSPELVYFWEDDGDKRTKPMANILGEFFEVVKCYSGKTLVQELKERGYDLDSFKFYIKKS